MTFEADEIVRLGDVGSTNDEAMARLRRGEGPLWLTAERQLKGRGRRGRTWVSEAGNLYASYGFFPSLSADVFGVLPLVSAIALSDALGSLGIEAQHKWPNDVLIKGLKCAGILLESEFVRGQRLTVIGFGVNVSHHPSGAPATCLVEQRPNIVIDEVFDALRLALADLIAILDDGSSESEQRLAPIRARWLARAIGVGGPVVVRFERETIEGRFLGLDPTGRLILGQEGREPRLVSAGDVFVGTEPL